jgi:hypothetical protein
MPQQSTRRRYHRARPYRRQLSPPWNVTVLATATLVAAGCTRQAPPGPDQAQRLAEDLARQLQAERLRQQGEQARHEAELTSAQSDCHGAVLAWASSTLAVVMLVLLLARERRGRRVLEKLLRLLLDRLRESRAPPSP